MQIIEPKVFPYPKILAKALAFFCFARVWRGGTGVDVVAWIKMDTVCKRIILITGDAAESELSSNLFRSELIPEFQVSSLIRQAARTGISILEPQKERVATAHFDDLFGIKEFGRSPRWISVVAGRYREKPAAKLLDLVLLECPEMAQSFIIK